jgi:hypothetical protein
MTPDDEKDRFGDKLHDLEKAREDTYFAERDRQLLQKLKADLTEQEEQTLREFVRMRCPKCSERLVSRTHLGVSFEECPAGHGMWIDKNEVEELAEREKTGWLARYLGR